MNTSRTPARKNKAMRMSLLAAVVMALAVVTAGAQSPDWTFEIVAEGIVGGGSCNSDMVIAPDGAPAVAYGSTSGKSPIVVFVRKAPSTGQWNYVTAGKGYCPSLAYGMLAGDPANPVLEPMIAYISDKHVLTFARPEAGVGPVSLDSYALRPSLAIDPITEYPAIAFLTQPEGASPSVLKLARWTGSAWSIETIVSGESIWDVSLAFDFTGRPAIAWISGDETAGYFLDFARRDPIDWWSAEPVVYLDPILHSWPERFRTVLRGDYSGHSNAYNL